MNHSKSYDVETYPLNLGLPMDIQYCPFCNHPGIVSQFRERHQPSKPLQDYWVRCTNSRCRSSGPSRSTPENAIEAWNRTVFLGLNLGLDVKNLDNRIAVVYKAAATLTIDLAASKLNTQQSVVLGAITAVTTILSSLCTQTHSLPVEGGDTDDPEHSAPNDRDDQT